MPQLLFIIKKEKDTLLMFQKRTQMIKGKLVFHGFQMEWGDIVLQYKNYWHY